MSATKSKISSRGAEMWVSSATGITAARIVWPRGPSGRRGAGRDAPDDRQRARQHVHAFRVERLALRLGNGLEAEGAQVPAILEVVHELTGEWDPQATGTAVAVGSDGGDAVAEEGFV